jgi:DNA-binding transcriptional ArsR family regulator
MRLELYDERRTLRQGVTTLRRVTEVNEPAIELASIDVVLGALADPVRLTFVRALDAAGDWTCGSDVLAGTDVSIGKSTLSHHIKVLREAGLIRTRVDGIRRLIALRDDDIERRFPGLLSMLRERDPAAAAPAESASTA